MSLEADPGQYAWLAQEGEQIVGYVSAFATQSLAAGRWEIDELAVHPQAQGRGVGTALVRRALEVGAQQSGLRETTGLTVVGLWERGTFLNPTATTPIHATTVLLMAGTAEQLKKYDEHFGGHEKS